MIVLRASANAGSSATTISAAISRFMAVRLNVTPSAAEAAR